MLAWLRKLFSRRMREPWRAVPDTRKEYPSPLLHVSKNQSCEPALVQDLHDIFKVKYIENVMDCSNKSAEYCRRLRAQGYTADVWAVGIPNQDLHAVCVFWDGLHACWLWVDPVILSWTTDVYVWGKPLYRFSDSWLYSNDNKESIYYVSTT